MILWRTNGNYAKKSLRIWSTVKVSWVRRCSSSGLEKMMGCTVPSCGATNWLSTWVLDSSLEGLSAFQPADDKWYVGPPLHISLSCLLLCCGGGDVLHDFGCHSSECRVKVPQNRSWPSQHDHRQISNGIFYLFFICAYLMLCIACNTLQYFIC